MVVLPCLYLVFEPKKLDEENEELSEPEENEH
jgi:hypothetical protein